MMSKSELFTRERAAVSWDDWLERVETELGEGAFERRLSNELLEGFDRRPLYAPGHPAVPELAPAPAHVGLPWAICAHLPIGAGLATEIAAQAAELDADALWLGVVAGPGSGARQEDAIERDLLSVAAAVKSRPVPVWFGASAHPAALVAGLAAAIGAPEVPIGAVLGGCGADPLGTLARGIPVALEGAFDEMAALGRWCTEAAPGARAALVSMAPYCDAGADAVQEVAFAVATGTAYLRRLVGAGSTVDEAASRIAFCLDAGRDLFLQIAKLRALRALWRLVVRNAGGAEEASRCLLHARAAWRGRTLVEPWNDLLRDTLAAVAAVAGGASALTLRPFDELQGGSELGRRLALTTQLVLRHEARLAAVADPAAGSWTVEALTEALCRRAWALFQGIEERGGMAVALAPGGFVENSVAAAAERRRQALAEGGLPLLGLNRYVEAVGAETAAATASEVPVRPADAAAASASPSGRQPGTTAEALARAAATAADGPQRLDALIAAARAGASLAELASVSAPATPEPPPALPPWRDAEVLETRREEVPA